MGDFTNGTERIFYIYVDGAYLPVGCLTSNSFSETSDMLDTTTRQNVNGWKTAIPTMQSYTISLSGLVSENNRTTTILIYSDIELLKRQKTKFSWKINTDDPEFNDYGFGHITSLSKTSELDSFISFSAEITGYGEPYQDETIADVLNYTLNVTI